MSTTAKDLAQKLGISQTAVSMALHNKPGVSTETRQKILRAAEKYGYDMSRIKGNRALEGTIYVVLYKTTNAILSYSPIFDELSLGVQNVASAENIRVRITPFWERNDDLNRFLEDLRVSDCIGVILVGTEISQDNCRKFTRLPFPIVLLDSSFDNIGCDCCLINNVGGAHQAVNYLIARRNCQPGYIRSAYHIPNFSERLVGFKKAVRENGMSFSRSIIHKISPSIEGSVTDMLELIDSGTQLADAYFCDNDIIAIGAIRALKLRGIRIPEDIGIIGFDNISEARIFDPSLTTMDVPRTYMAECATRQLIHRIRHPQQPPIKIEVPPVLIKRFSL